MCQFLSSVRKEAKNPAYFDMALKLIFFESQRVNLVGNCVGVDSWWRFEFLCLAGAAAFETLSSAECETTKKTSLTQALSHKMYKILV